MKILFSFLLLSFSLQVAAATSFADFSTQWVNGASTGTVSWLDNPSVTVTLTGTPPVTAGNGSTAGFTLDDPTFIADYGNVVNGLFGLTTDIAQNSTR